MQQNTLNPCHHLLRDEAPADGIMPGEQQSTPTAPTLSGGGDSVVDDAGDQEEPQNESTPGDTPEGETQDYALAWADNSTVDPSTRDVITGIGKELDIPADKLGQFVARMESHFTEAADAQQAETAKLLQEKEASLRKAWGREYDDRVRGACNMAVRMCRQAGVDPVVFEQLGIDSHPDMMRVFGAVAQVMGESRLPAAEASASANRAEAERIRTDPSHPLYGAYHNPANPKAFIAAQDRYKELMQ